MYRFFEILPAFLAWTTLVLMVVLSAVVPTAMAVFIILFDIYWLLKTVFLSLHLRSSFQLMREVMATDWLKELSKLPGQGWRDLHHLVVLPMYKEPYEVVKESFDTLSAADYPKDKIWIVLATEERAGEEAAAVAERIRSEYGRYFGHFIVSRHPADLPGEIPGKGSNETWAVKQAIREIVEPSGISTKRVLVSVFDVDTQVKAGYFGRLAYIFSTVPEPMRAIYQPIPLFTNNVYHAPALARVVSFSATFWQMMQQSRPERLTSFSSLSIPLSVLQEIGFWHRDIVSEDSRIFWQCYMHYHGDFRCEPLFYSVSMDANVAPKFWQTMKNLYKQQRRWAWGVENTPYLVNGFIKDRSISFGKKLYWSFTDIEGRHSWATNALIIFALGWLPSMLGGEAFTATLLSHNLPYITEFIVRLSMIGIVTSAVLTLVLLPPKPEWFRPYHYILYFLQWVLMPITLIIFGCVPALDAQTRLALGGKWRLGFWVTPKGRYNLAPR